MNKHKLQKVIKHRIASKIYIQFGSYLHITKFNYMEQGNPFSLKLSDYSKNDRQWWFTFKTVCAI